MICPLDKRKRPDIGLALILSTATLFWGFLALLGQGACDLHQKKEEISLTCEHLIATGWNSSLADCVRDLTP